MRSIETSLLATLGRKGALVTWVNHYSLQVCLDKNVDLKAFDCVGVDGLFLLRLLGLSWLKRSSADLFLPQLFHGRSFKIGLIGGTDQSKIEHKRSIELLFPSNEILWSINGFEEVRQYQSGYLELPKPDLILIGMGPALQELTAIRLGQKFKEDETSPILVTCGGWLDQNTITNYYPSWAYPLRLNWLVRLAREPRRLLPRYTFWAARAILKRKFLQNTAARIGNLAS